MTQPKVSVFMITYNHEKYISEAIEGILMQRTNFDYDIVIGEDCSTDNTRNIILDYQKKYPGKFKLLLHDTNIGANANQKAVLNNCSGKYIAFCEGDDYWTDPLKLQKQIDLMESYPSHNLSFHPVIYADKKIVMNKYFEEVTQIPVDSIIKSNGGFVPTASMVIKKNAMNDYIKFQEICPDMPIGDYFIAVISAIPNGALFFPFAAAIYRDNISSMTKSLYLSQNTRLIFCKKMLNAYKKLDNFTNNKYSDLFKIRKNEFLKWNFKYFIKRIKFFQAIELVLFSLN